MQIKLRCASEHEKQTQRKVELGREAHCGPSHTLGILNTRDSFLCQCNWLTSCRPERGISTVLGSMGNISSPSDSESDVFSCK